MRERPILMSGPMVRAILGGHKTQTRRIVKPRTPEDFALMVDLELSDDPAEIAKTKAELLQCRCPYGVVGDRLVCRWRPSIHMPRPAFRLTLEVASVRVERLQEITEGEAAREGVSRIEYAPWSLYGQPVHPRTSSYREAFAALWDDLHGPGAWEADPYCWVITFQRLGATA